MQCIAKIRRHLEPATSSGVEYARGRLLGDLDDA